MGGRVSGVFRLAPGQTVRPNLGWVARSVRIDNLGGQWPQLDRSYLAPIGPYTQGAMLPIADPSESPIVYDAPVPGFVSDGTGTAAYVVFYEEMQAYSPGIQVNGPAVSSSGGNTQTVTFSVGFGSAHSVLDAYAPGNGGGAGLSAGNFTAVTLSDIVMGGNINSKWDFNLWVVNSALNPVGSQIWSTGAAGAFTLNSGPNTFSVNTGFTIPATGDFLRLEAVQFGGGALGTGLSATLTYTSP